MAKVNYRVCDICGNTLNTDERCRGYTNGYRIWNKLFNRLDICSKCMDKIKYLSIDKEDEQKYVNEFFRNEKKYDSLELQTAYYEGLEDALNILSYKRLKDIEIPKR